MRSRVGVLIAALQLASLTFAESARAQSSRDPRSSAWAVTLDVGAFLQGNKQAVAHWLRHNGYGITQPKQCGFDLLLRPTCEPAVNYPQVAESGIVAGVVSIRRTLTNRFSLELLAATEQSGAALGRCDDLAVPKDSRCVDRLLEVDFGGASVAMTGVIATRYLRLGAGPALMLANWRMSPAHLAGVWFDAMLEREPFPFFARAQYRVYRSANLGMQGFSGFHPSTLFVGVGVIARTNNPPP
jgi:hypothetical protein